MSDAASPDWSRTSGVDANRQSGSLRGRLGAPTALVMLLLSLSSLTSCHVTNVRVGMGSNGVRQESMQQYYLFFGLLSLNDVDIQRVVGEYTSYDGEGGFCNRGGFWDSVSDFMVSMLFLPLTVTRQTVTVKYGP